MSVCAYALVCVVCVCMCSVCTHCILCTQAHTSAHISSKLHRIQDTRTAARVCTRRLRDASVSADPLNHLHVATDQLACMAGCGCVWHQQQPSDPSLAPACPVGTTLGVMVVCHGMVSPSVKHHNSCVPY